MMDGSQHEKSGKSEAIVIVKAAPQIGAAHGETVCCAAIDPHGNWLRLYPIQFRHLEESQKFGRWDRIQFKWRKPTSDVRIESRRVDQDTLTIVGQLKPAERAHFLAKSIVTSLKREREQGRSLALLEARSLDFVVERKNAEELAAQRKEFLDLQDQQDLFRTKHLVPYEPAPYRFKYRYVCDDGERFGTCQDWEIEATFFKWSKKYGEPLALDRMKKTFGEEYPRKGMLLAMGTHSRWPDNWLINGIVRLDHTDQLPLL
jgi:hypothetical protein